MARAAAHRLGEKIALGMALRAIGCVGWAGANGLVKWASEQGAGLLQMLFIRNVIALGLITLFILTTAGPQALRTAKPGSHALRALIGIAGMACGYAAVVHMPLTEATAVSFTMPLFITLLSAPFLKERVGPAQWAAVGAGFLGVLVMVRPDPAHMANLGAVLGLLGALGGAGSTVTIRELARTERGPTIVFYFLLFGTLCTAIPAALTWKALSGPILLALAGVGLLSATVQLAFTQSLKLAPPAVIAPIDYTQVLWAGLIAWLVWDERLRAATVLGGLIVMGAGLYILWSETRRPKAAGDERPDSGFASSGRDPGRERTSGPAH